MTPLPVAPVNKKAISALLAAGTTYLKEKAIVSARLETEEILSAVLSCRRIDLYVDPERPIFTKQQKLFWRFLERRAGDEPLQYITGHVEFFGLSFKVRTGVFIPRPETELIIEAAIKMSPSPRHILDLCTGSGALAVTLAKQFPSARTIATDCSETALSVARSNIQAHDCESKISLFKGDLFDPLPSHFNKIEPFDLIVCNPPYISEADTFTLPRNVRDYEPEIALFADNEGRSFYPRILSEAPSFLAEKGSLLLELGAGQSDWLRQFIEKETVFDVVFIEDWTGIERIAHVIRD